MTSRRRGAGPDQSGSPSVTGRRSRCATTKGSATTPSTSVPTRSSGRLVGAVSGRTWATHHHAPVCSGTQRVRSAKARSASSCQSATSRRAWSTCEGLDADPRVRRSERLVMVARSLLADAAYPSGVVQSALSVESARPEDFDRIAELTVGVYVDGQLASDGYTPQLADVAGRAARSELLVVRDVGGRIVGSVALVLSG